MDMSQRDFNRKAFHIGTYMYENEIDFTIYEKKKKKKFLLHFS